MMKKIIYFLTVFFFFFLPFTYCFTDYPSHITFLKAFINSWFVKKNVSNRSTD